jgi:hypothetical protein
MDTDTASEICYELAVNGCFSTSQFADRAGVLGWAEPDLIRLLETVPGIKRVSHSWWKLQSRMWRAVRGLGIVVVVATVIAFLV